MLILFTTIGATFLLATADLVSMYLAIELQSFSLYILSTIYKNSQPSTAAGLRYFLIGALASSLILLGSTIIYNATGATHFQDLATIIKVITEETLDDHSQYYTIYTGFILFTMGLLIKSSAAPFHS